MAFKFIAAFALVAVASAGLIPAPQVYHAAPAAVAYSHAPVAVAHAQPILAKHADDEYDPHPQYKYGYDVQDAISGDSKSAVEERDGDVVRGEYSLIDADGYKRTVQYTADPINGFNAVVNREPLVKSVVAAPVAHYAAPAAVVKTVAPVAHYAAAPVAHYAAAPVSHYAAAPVAHYAAAPAAHYAAAPVAHYAAAPVAHYAAPAVVKTVAAPAYTTYSAPAAYVAHH